MKKYYLLAAFLVLFTSCLFPQQFGFAWLTDTHVGSPGGSENLIKAVNDINAKNFPFVIVSGDITEKGRNSELDEAKQILDSLKIKYYIIPGNHDTKWTESACSKFKELWGNDKFNFKYNGIHFIGINTGIVLRGGGGHITPEDVVWFDSVLAKSDKNEELVVITHHPLDGDVDNWFEITNRLQGRRILALLYGHGRVNRVSTIAGIPAIMSRSTLTDKEGKWGYNSISFSQDSLFFYEENGDSLTTFIAGLKRSEKISPINTDTLQFINYEAEVLAQYNLKKTISAPLYVNGNNIYAVTLDGVLNCFSSDGKIKWTCSTGGVIASKPVVQNNIAIVGTIQGDLITIDNETGRVIQTMGVNDVITSQLITQKVKFENDTVDAVIVGTASGALMCYELNSLQEVWKNTDAMGMIETEPLIVNGKIIYGCWDSYLYCIELETGRIIWKYTGNKNFYYSPAACKPVSDGKSVFISTPDKFVASVDLMIGRANWRKKDSDCWESIGISNNNKYLYIKSITDKFYILAAKDGKVIKSIDCKFGTDTMPIEIIESDGNIYFSTKKGIIYLIDKNYKLKPLLFLGTSRALSVKQVSDGVFVAANMDGKIVVFKYNPVQE